LLNVAGEVLHSVGLHVLKVDRAAVGQLLEDDVLRAVGLRVRTVERIAGGNVIKLLLLVMSFER
jgi:hypothetical protein